MSPTFTRLRTEAGTLLALAGPIIVNNLSIAGMQFADAVMAGRISAAALAAVAVGGSVWFLHFTLALGLMMAISPIASGHRGEGNDALIGRYTRQGLYLAVALGVPVIIVAHTAIAPLLAYIGIDEAFRATTVDYVGAISWGAPGIFMFLALRFTTEGVGHTRPIMYTSVFALVCNVLLNWVFMFGNLGAPALGAVGAAVASAVTMWCICLILGAYMVLKPLYRRYELFSRVAPPRPEALREIIALGIPIAVTITAEVGLFNAVSILMGTLGPAITAAHQIAINFSMTTFMVPLAVASAITVRVSFNLGRGDPGAARFSGVTGILLCAGFMFCSATVLLLFRDLIVGVYTSDSAVRDIAISLLLVAAVFQVADGIQVSAAGSLRGYKDTRVPMLVTTFAYWVLAFPLAYLAAVTYRLPPHWIWVGFVIGLSTAALLLSLRFARLSKPPHPKRVTAA